MVMFKVLTNQWKYPWDMFDIKEKIITTLQAKEVRYMHIMREGNQLADHCANLALDEGNFICSLFNQLDSKAKRILNSVKLQCPYIRITSMKRRQ